MKIFKRAEDKWRVISKIDKDLSNEVAAYGARDMDACMQCGTCSASCPLSSGANTFPRKIYRYLQLGLRDKLLESCEPWLCYYCGDCNKDCPRGAEPAETMMAARRWLTAQYDWTGLAKRIYLSPAWELGAFLFVALGIVALFLFGHGPVVTDRVELNTFAPVHWVKIGDKIMLGLVGALLLSNAFRMYRRVMRGTRVPFWRYFTEAPTFVLNYFTQKRWRKCGEERQSRWLRHLLLFSGYVTMEVLVVGFLDAFQTDVVHPMWHPTRIFGYYATVVLMIISVDMMISRYRKKEDLHRFSDFTDWFFLLQIFMTAFTGLLVHIFRLAGWPLLTYGIYVLHLAIAVAMICTMIPFGKLSHLFYRPLALYLAAVKEKATKQSEVDIDILKAEAGDLFMSCMQCGACTGACPQGEFSDLNPRRIIRQLTLDTANADTVDRAVWSCVTCNACGVHCPRGIEIPDLIGAARQQKAAAGALPKPLKSPLTSLKANGNPWNGAAEARGGWAEDVEVDSFAPEEHEYCLFACCTTAYDSSNRGVGSAIVQLLGSAGVSFGTLGGEERCCGDPAHRAGDEALFETLSQENTERFRRFGVKRLLTTSPHCLDTFKKRYPDLDGEVQIEHYTELLDRLMAADRLIPIERVERTVTYHDPCYLGRHNGVYEAPRRVLGSIPGLKLVEMSRNRKESLCCGGGGGGAWLGETPGLAEQRIREALDTGAEVIATACPYCIRMLDRAVKALGVERRIEVRDLAEILWQSVDTTMIAETAHRQASSLYLESPHA